jgi:hypothetical protein
MSLDDVRAVADAVLYEGYLLYPYRASAQKNQMRWQFGVLSPPGAGAAHLGEEPGLAMECLLRVRDPAATVTIRLRFLQLQVREVQRCGSTGFVTVPELVVDGRSMLSWDEAVEHEIALPACPLDLPADLPVTIPGGEDVEPLGEAGRVRRRRWPLTARVRTDVTPDEGYLRLSVSVDNEYPEPVADKDAAIRAALIGAHLLIEAQGADFVSLLEPPPPRPPPRAGAISTGAGPCWPGRPVRPTSCSARRSSCTTIRRLPRRARARCSTRPRSTRSSPCG